MSYQKMTHKCKKCNILKPLTDFYKNGGGRSGYRNKCKTCTSDDKKQYRKDNIDELRAKEREYRKNNKETERIRSWRQSNRDKQIATSKRYYEKNRDDCIRRGTEYTSKRRKNDINYKLRHNISRRLNVAFKNNQKTGSIIDYLGCSIEDLKKHLESKFTEGMSWDNYGEWHIDHIRPLASFDLTDLNQFKKACHYSNLQPLWALDNMRKSDKLWT